MGVAERDLVTRFLGSRATHPGVEAHPYAGAGHVLMSLSAVEVVPEQKQA